ncbi:MAG: hypothetical protein ACOYEQ_05870 [Bacillota bacterium]
MCGVRIADDDELLIYLQILVQQLRVLLKIAVAPLIENKEVRAGIITVIRDDEQDRVRRTYLLIQRKDAVPNMRACISVCETFIIACSTRCNLQFRKGYKRHIVEQPAH